VLLDVGEHLLLGLVEGESAVELGEQPRLLVHGPHEVAHLVERLGRGLDDEVHALAEHLEVVVGDQRGDLDQGVGPEVEAGHLAVDPHQSFLHDPNPRPYVGTKAPGERGPSALSLGSGPLRRVLA
jgi:hypothetical protein